MLLAVLSLTNTNGNVFLEHLQIFRESNEFGR